MDVIKKTIPILCKTPVTLRVSNSFKKGKYGKNKFKIKPKPINFKLLIVIFL